MRKFTTREKVLIYVALLLAIWFIGHYLLVMPAKFRNETAKADLAMIRMEEKAQAEKLEKREELLAAHEEDRDFYLEHRDDFGTPLSDAELEQSVLTYLERYEFRPYKTVITDIEERLLETNEDVGELKILVGQVYVEASGDWEKFCDLLDEAEGDERIMVVQFSVKEPEDEGGPFVFTVTLDYYMMEDPNG